MKSKRAFFLRTFLLNIMVVSGMVSIASCGNKSEASSDSSIGLPALNKIQTYEFKAAYSCKASGYEGTALFMSSFSRERNSPDLLLNGACSSAQYFEAATAGNDIALIADLGAIPLSIVTPAKAINFERTVGYDNVFKSTSLAVVGHTYAVVTAKRDLRSMYIFTVDYMGNDGSMRIRYAVKNYELHSVASESTGFDWEKTSQ